MGALAWFLFPEMRAFLSLLHSFLLLSCFFFALVNITQDIAHTHIQTYIHAFFLRIDITYKWIPIIFTYIHIFFHSFVSLYNVVGNKVKIYRTAIFSLYDGWQRYLRSLSHTHAFLLSLVSILDIFLWGCLFIFFFLFYYVKY